MGLAALRRWSEIPKVVSPGASHSGSSPDSRGTDDRSSSDLSRVERFQMVASVVQADNSGTYQDASGIPMLPVSQGQSAVSPQNGPTDHCAHQCQSQHLSGGDVLSQEDREFLRFHIRAGTERNYAYGWRRFTEFCNDRMVEPTVASTAIVVKFIVAMLKENLKYQNMNRAVSAISKHH